MFSQCLGENGGAQQRSTPCPLCRTEEKERTTHPTVFKGARLPGKHNSLALRDVVEKDKPARSAAVWDISDTNLVV